MTTDDAKSYTIKIKITDVVGMSSSHQLIIDLQIKYTPKIEEKTEESNDES